MLQKPHRLTAVRLALILACGLLGLAALGVAGRALVRRPAAADLLADYRAALAPGFAMAPAQLEALSAYSITVQIDPGSRAYTGTLEVSFPVTGTAPWQDVCFRLYPNLDQYNGRLDVTGASLNGITASYQYTSERTAVQILPARPLPIGTRARAQLRYAGQAPLNDDSAYTLFGQGQGILALPFFYPMMPARRGDKWSLEVADPQGDYGFEGAALYQVDVTAPADEVIAATGAATHQTPRSGGLVTTHYVMGPAREFALALSPRYQVLDGEANGAQIHSYFLPEDADSGKAALIDAIAAIQIYSDEFGPYPFRNMSAVEVPIGTHGQELPGMSFLGSDDYGSHQDSLEVLIAHEFAHQWWYNQVGNDRTQTPWLGEALAESSVYIYFADRHGVPAAELLRQQRWEAPVSYAASAGHDAPIGLPVASYNQSNYETIVYAKGALFMLALRDELGAFQYRRGLQTYLNNCRWRIATPDDLRHAMESVSGKDLRSLFDKWVGGAVG